MTPTHKLLIIPHTTRARLLETVTDPEERRTLENIGLAWINGHINGEQADTATDALMAHWCEMEQTK
jgi:hypothetical protein